MNQNWTCSYCGCTSKHYNSSVARYVCDQCSRPVDSFEDEQQRMAYDRAIINAKDHMRVGNWDECCRLIEPICNNRPADHRAYMILLAAYTSGYTDYLVFDRAKLSKAADCWDKLCSLHKINAMMREYQNSREIYIRRTHSNRLNKSITLFIIAFLLCMLIPACHVISGWLTFFDVVIIVGITWYNIVSCIPITTLSKVIYLNKTRLSNPFRYKV